MKILFDTLVEALAANIWVLVGLLISLTIVKRVRDDIRPIFVAIVGPLAKNAGSNAIVWAQGILLAILSLLGALSEVAVTMHWIYIGILCKVSGPPIATIIALTKQSPVAQPPA